MQHAQPFSNMFKTQASLIKLHCLMMNGFGKLLFHFSVNVRKLLRKLDALQSLITLLGPEGE